MEIHKKKINEILKSGRNNPEKSFDEKAYDKFTSFKVISKLFKNYG